MHLPIAADGDDISRRSLICRVLLSLVSLMSALSLACLVEACAVGDSGWACRTNKEVGCFCRMKDGRSGPMKGATPTCTEEYECCAQYSNISVLADDPNPGQSVCNCWNRGPGETCGSRPPPLLGTDLSPKVKRRPKTCPPSFWDHL